MAKEKKKEEGFIVHFSTYDTAVEDLTLEQMGELFVKLGRYHFYGEDVSSDDKGVRMVLKMVKPYMKSASERYEEAVKNGMKGKSHGIKGGRPRKGETREEYDARRLERVRMLEARAESPPKPLNTNRNRNIDNDIDKNIDKEIDTDIEIKKTADIDNNTNVKNNTSTELISNSISILNSESGSSQLRSLKTAYEEETYPQEVIEDNSNVDELDESAGNYLGSIEEIMRGEGHSNLTPPNTPILLQREPSKNEIIAAIRSEVDAAIDCKQEGQPYIEHMYNARDIYMKFKRCDKKRAQEDLSWLYQLRKRGECDFLANMI